MPKRSALQYAARYSFHVLKRVLPGTRPVDDFLSRIYFYGFQGRLPGRRRTLEDYLFTLKISDDFRDPLRAEVTDKELAKRFIADRVGDRYNVPTLAVLKSREELKAYRFPETCVVKATHSCGRNVLRKAGEPLDLTRLESWFAHNFYRSGREANYRDLQPKIIVEPYIGDGAPLEEFKVFCRNGEPKLFRRVYGRYAQGHRSWLDLDLNVINAAGLPDPAISGDIAKDCREEMLDVSRRLSAPFSFIRVDMFRHDGRIYVSELTNLPNNTGYVFDEPKVGEAVNALFFA